MQRKLVSNFARRAFTGIAVQVVLSPAAFAAPGLAAAAAAATAAPEPARPPIVLALDPCAAVDAKEVRRLLPIEMGAPLAGSEGDQKDTTRVTVGCVVDSPSLVRLEVRDATTGRTLDRFITLLGVPRSDQARLVAIAAVELVAASKSALAPAPDAVPHLPELAAPIVVVTPPPPPPREPRWRIAGVASLRHFGGLPRLAVGGGLAAEYLRRHLVLGADLVAEGMPQPTALGDVDSVLFSGSLTGGVRGARGPVSAEIGAGARLGVARLAGQARQPAAVATGVVSAAWFGPLGAARVALTLPRGFTLALAGEVGYATGGVLGTVTDRPSLSVHGTWWGATLGLGYAY